MAKPKGITIIRITLETKKALDSFGIFGEDYNDCIQRLLDEYNKLKNSTSQNIIQPQPLQDINDIPHTQKELRELNKKLEPKYPTSSEIP